MGIKDVVQEAALVAVRYALPTLPEGLVRWQDDPQVQAEADLPNVVLSEVSMVPDGPMVRRRKLNGDGRIVETFDQTYTWRVQCAFEAWRTPTGHVLPLIMRSRFGWYTDEARTALADTGRPKSLRTPLKLVYQVGQIVPQKTRAAGHSLPRYYYEIPFRFVDYGADPETQPTLEGADIGGTISDGVDDIPIAFSAPE